jgi:hypothetical protein
MPTVQYSTESDKRAEKDKIRYTGEIYPYKAIARDGTAVPLHPLSRAIELVES